MGGIWCRHNCFRPKYCRNNCYYKKLHVDLGIVDLSDEGANILELINVGTNNELILDLNL